MVNFSLRLLPLISSLVLSLSVLDPPPEILRPVDLRQNPVERLDREGEQPSIDDCEIGHVDSEGGNDDVYEILFSVLDDYFGDMYAQYVDSLASPSDADFESGVVPFMGEADVSALEDADTLSVYDSSAISNVLSYHVRIDGTAYLLYLSPDDIDRIYIDSSNRMWNVGTSQITGRLFQGSFNPTATTGMVMYLSPCLGNNFSNNEHYGSPNYYRNYYWNSNNNLTYTTTYCTITVEDTTFPLINSMVPSLVIIFLVGVIFVCLLRKYHS